MTRPRIAALVSAAALLATGCGDAITSMTQHWFYGYVASAGQGELCLADARTEDLEAQRCFSTEGASLPQVAEGDLVKVQYERSGDGHGGGNAVAMHIIRAEGQPDR